MELRGQAEVVSGEQSLRVCYSESGSAGASQTTVVLLHGSGPGSNADSVFLSSRPVLMEAGFRLLAIDLPGWGRSDPVICAEDRSALNARAVNAVLDAAGIAQPVHLMGASMGAHAAAAFALHYPARAGRLVLVAGGTGGRSSFHPERPEGVCAMLDFYGDPTPQKMRTFLRTVFHHDTPVPDQLVEQMFDGAMARREHLDKFVISFQQNPVQFSDITGRLAEIRSPALVIWGSDDRFVPLDIGLQIALRMPHADFHVLGRCGHAPHLERADDFNRVVRQFLVQAA